MIQLFKNLFKNRKAIKAAQEHMLPILNQHIEQDNNKKISIAICLSGHIRNYKQLSKNFDEFRNLLSEYGTVNVFLATWDRQNAKHSWSGCHGLSMHNSYEIKVDIEELQNNFAITNLSINDENFYASKFSPLQYKNFTNQIYNWDGRGENNGIINSYKMFYLIYKSNNLKLYYEYANNFTYDWVFRVRPDMQFDINICKEVIKLNLLDNNKIYMSSIRDDQFAFGGSQLMNKHANVYKRSIFCYDSGIFGDPENICEKIYLNFIGRENIIDIPKCGKIATENPDCPLRLR